MLRRSTNEFQLIRPYMPELDCLRGVAILSVVLYHGIYWLNPGPYSAMWENLVVKATLPGWLGVNLFFILSGFLITGILMDAKPDRTYYKSFYVKRALRIVPALAATLILAAFLRMTSFGGAVISVFFLVNYAGVLGVSGAYGPLWSLAVEEHFYLIWPTVIHRFKASTIAFIAFLLCVLEPMLRYFAVRWKLGDPHFHTHLIADYLATGALLAVFGRSRFATKRNSIMMGSALIVLAVLLLRIGMPYGILHRDNSFGDALQVVPFNLLFAGTLTLMLAAHSTTFSSVWASPLRYLGYVSYGLYLYHLLVFSLVMRGFAQMGVLQGKSFHAMIERFVLMFGASLLASDVSRRWMEQWFLNKKRILAS